ncbi:MAG: leucine-rich repeat protein [Clostridia bacterium]|nr:leucine-rich repeat protein [Clostridia bacterium]
MAKFMRKPIAFLLLAVMLMQMLPVIAFATGSEMKLTVSSATGYTGETVEITVAISNNPGISSLMFDIEYDSVLTLTNVTFSEAFGSLVTTPEPYTNPQTITLISPYEDVTANGVLATLTFEVSKEATHDYVADVEITFDENNIFNASSELVETSAVNGAVTVFRGIPGDINSDRVVDTKDAVLLFRYVAGWDVTVDSRALDCNGDGIVNTHDPIALFRFVAGWPNINLYYGVNYDYYSRGLKYSINSDGRSYSVAMGDCTDTDVVIPLTYNGLPVTGISNRGFVECSELKSISIPNTVTSIGEFAFNECSSLTSITIPYGVTQISERTFWNCTSLKRVNIPDSVTIIESYAFWKCGQLTGVTIPENVTVLGTAAFADCSSITSIIIPNSVISMGSSTRGGSVFSGCTNLRSITIPDSVTEFGPANFSDCTSLTSAKIGSGVTELGNRTFFRCSSLKNVSMGSSVTHIGEDAFYECEALESIVISNSVETIDKNVFTGCSSLKSVTIPASVSKIDSGAFSEVPALCEVHISDLAAWCSIDFYNTTSNPLSTAGNLYLNDELLTHISIPEGVTTINGSVFAGCTSITSVIIPKSVTTIQGVAFYRCTSLTDVFYEGTMSEWWNGVTVVGEGTNAPLLNATIHFEYKAN